MLPWTVALPRSLIAPLGSEMSMYCSSLLFVLVPAAFVTFFGAQVFLRHYGHGSALSDPTVLRVILATAVYLALIGLLGSALGWILRSTPGGISTLVGILLVVPVLLEVVPGAWANWGGTAMPTSFSRLLT